MNTPDTAPPRRLPAGAGALLPLTCALVLAGGCAPRVDLKRMTYEALRREDCRLNQIDQFCQRNFAREYVEYERLRRHFMRDARDTDVLGGTGTRSEGAAR